MNATCSSASTVTRGSVKRFPAIGYTAYASDLRDQGVLENSDSDAKSVGMDMK